MSVWKRLSIVALFCLALLAAVTIAIRSSQSPMMEANGAEHSLISHSSAQSVGSPNEVSNAKRAAIRLMSTALSFGLDQMGSTAIPPSDAKYRAWKLSMRNRLAEIWAPEKVNAEAVNFERLLKQNPPNSVAKQRLIQTRLQVSKWDQASVSGNDARLYGTGILLDFYESTQRSTHEGQYQIHLVRSNTKSDWRLENYRIVSLEPQG